MTTLVPYKKLSVALTACAIYCATAPRIGAASVTPADARAAAAGWLTIAPNPMRAFAANAVVGKVKIHNGNDGRPLFFEAAIQPAGFVIMPADDAMEPILAFTGHGRFDPTPAHPLGALVRGDLAARAAVLRETPADTTTRQAARTKWRMLIGAAAGLRAGIADVSDVCVPPFIQSAWDQMRAGNVLCYNYWTPENYACGCLPTAMAQLMRHHQHPPIGVGTPSFTIEVNGVEQTRALLGGDGHGSPYVWDWMTLSPDANTPETNRMEIGALCHDAGVAAGTHYSTNSTATGFTAAAGALRDAFFYSQSVIGYNSGTNIGDALNAMINPGLDAGLPSILGVFYGASGHAVLADGYGYDNNTLYHHLNLGWGASFAAGNVWYALPMVDTPGITYNVIKICTYNIFTYGTGEIVSGRIVDRDGAPLAGAALILAVTNGPTLTATSNARGIYAFAGVPANSDAGLTAAKPGYLFESQVVRTGKSKDQTATCGNRWSVNFTGTVSRLPVPADYDGDGKADLAWYDESNGAWQIRPAANTNAPVSFVFGGAGWAAMPADYDGDGKTDPAIHHSGASIWRVLLSAQNHREHSLIFGGPGWQGVPADYDGDGKADPAIHRAATGLWQARLSSRNYALIAPPSACGGPAWTPAPADYDGDGKADPAAWTSATGEWKALISSDNYQPAGMVFADDINAQAVPADYDGDGKTDPAVYHPAAGQWSIYRSSSGYARDLIPFGGNGEFAAPADYTGAGHAQPGLYNINDDTWRTHSTD